MSRSVLSHRWQTLAVLLVAALMACGGDDGTGPTVATQLAFTVQPTDATAGASIAPAGASAMQSVSGNVITATVAIQDASGNVVTTATNAVTIAIGTNPGGGTLSGPPTVSAVAGVASFSGLTIDKAGSGYTLVASATGLTGATSSALAVTPAAPAQLGFTVQPTDATAGVAIAEVEVGVEDAFGNVVTTATDAVTIAIGTNPAGGTLSGTPTVSAVNGVAALSDLSIEKAGSGYTLAASATGLTGATSAAFDITAAAAAQLAFLTPPGNATVRTTIAPAIEVEILDQFSNLVPTATDVVTLAIQLNPGDMLVHASGFLTPILERVDPVTPTVLPVLPNAPALGEEIFGLTYYQPTDRVLASVGDFNVGNNNLASIDATDGAVTTLGLIGTFAAGPQVRPLVVEPGTGRLLGGERFGNRLCEIDPNTGAPTVLGAVSIVGDVILNFNGLSYDPTGILYGAVILNSTVGTDPRIRTLVTIDVPSLTATFVAPLSDLAVSSIAFLQNGDLLAVTGDQANFMPPVNPETLWLVNQATGVMTLILALGNGDSGEVIATVPPILTGSTTVTAVNGVAVFNVAIDGSGTGYILAATAPGLTFAESAAFDIIQ